MTTEGRKRLHDIRLAAGALCRFTGDKSVGDFKAGDREWERIVSDPRPRPKLDAFVAQALREEPSGLIL